MLLDKRVCMQYITHTNSRYGYIDGAQAALDGGCRWIQLRMKQASLEAIREAALRLLPICRSYGAVFILDDQVDLALEIGADGVHLGKQDMEIAQARAILGCNLIIGGTANTGEDIAYLASQGVDYIGCGPFRLTQTKQNLSPIIGLSGYGRLILGCRQAHINTPIVAIGGVELEDIEAILQQGVDGIALSGLILNAENPKQKCAEVMNLINQHIV